MRVPPMASGLTLALTLSLTLAACGKPADNAANQAGAANSANAVDVIAIPEDSDATAHNATNATAAQLPTEAWLGRWIGPEGLFLDVAAGSKPGLYKLTLKDNLDSQAEYEGRADGAAIRFTRAGKAETIRAGNGEDTGFKWLADKTDCLIVVKGEEGYCR